MRPPSVDALARTIADVELPHPLLIDAARAAIASGDPNGAREIAEATRDSLLRPVINATGVLLHTNLGRAPFGFDQTAEYTNLELDLATGKRGSRRDHAGALLARACGADAALVVNNGAAAVLLASPRWLVAKVWPCRGASWWRSAAASASPRSWRNQAPISSRSAPPTAPAARTTRRVRAEVELILKVHQSNYRITGFTASADVESLAELGPPVVVDIGSGLLDAACPWLPDGPPAWLRDEPAVRQTLASGAALVVFSGDKLVGGPQAGIIAGRADLVDACARHPLSRAAARRSRARRAAASRDLPTSPAISTGCRSGEWRRRRSRSCAAERPSSTHRASSSASRSPAAAPRRGSGSRRSASRSTATAPARCGP